MPRRRDREATPSDYYYEDDYYSYYSESRSPTPRPRRGRRGGERKGRRERGGTRHRRRSRSRRGGGGKGRRERGRSRERRPMGGGGPGGKGGGRPGFGGGGGGREAKRTPSRDGDPSNVYVWNQLVKREKARIERNFNEADRLRDGLRELGIEIYDRERRWEAKDGRVGQRPNHDDKEKDALVAKVDIWGERASDLLEGDAAKTEVNGRSGLLHAAARENARGARVLEEAESCLSEADREAAVPKMPETKTSAASFASMEALGVPLPPTQGWKPESSATKGQSMWLMHQSKSEWIYNMTEDKYFHLPSKTLWEKRPLKSQDPRLPAFTYVRTDAFHLQALRHFAASLDSGAVPLAWQSWVLYVKKKRAVQIAPTPPVVEEVPVDAGTPTTAAAGAVASSSPEVEAPAEVETSPGLVEAPTELKSQVNEPSPPAPPEPEPAPQAPQAPQTTAKTPKPKPRGGCCLCLRSSSHLSRVDSDADSDEEASPFLPKPKSEPAPVQASDRTASTATPQASWCSRLRSSTHVKTLESEKVPFQKEHQTLIATLGFI
ncbi:unnamed protein product [Durusdinium trenchii]|uniref:Uncharacterized protein n=1 Tax=Durusdinium trenchii TaxID=1381693 RepID=A0ABP0MFF8_9DINO